MGESIINAASSTGSEKPAMSPTPFGKAMAKHFLFDPSFKNMNHGSFGAYPRAVQKKLREIQDAHEASPDVFIRYTYPGLLDESRVAVAKLLNVPVSTCVFVPNATTAINTVLRNLTWNPDGKDEILYFSFIYEACGKTIDYICESANDKVGSRNLVVPVPFSDDELLSLLRSAISDSRSAGKHPRILHLETIVSQPGISLPYQAITQICHEEGVLSLIDGAHGLGQIPLDLSSFSPDFFCSNLHKWLFVPRGCAVLYVAPQHQDSMRSTLPTSHGFVPRGQVLDRGPLPVSKGKSDFVVNFEFVGSIDDSPYVCVGAALKFRAEVCGGEEAIIEYNLNLARQGGAKVAEILGTRVLDNEEGTLTNTCMTNVLLPVEKAEKISAMWMLDTLLKEYKTFIPLIGIEGKLWTRLSAQVYLDVDDFEWTGKALKDVCERVSKGEHLVNVEEVMEDFKDATLVEG